MSTTVSTHIWRPSSARVLSLDNFIPVPRGNPAAVAAPLFWPVKDPADVLDYQLNFAAAFVGNEGDAIASFAVGVNPNAPGDLVLNGATADGAAAIMWFSGGQAGTVYTITLSVTTVNGRSLQRSAFLPVVSLSSASPPAGSLTTEAGLTVTDQNGNPVFAI